MCFDKLAEEFIDTEMVLCHIPENQQLIKAIHGEMFVLGYLSAHGKRAYPKELSKALDVSTARIARMLNHMEEKGLIVRQVDGQDMRQKIVILTEKGDSLSVIQHKEAVEAARRILERLGFEDACEFLRIQRKMIDSIAWEVTQMQQ